MKSSRNNPVLLQLDSQFLQQQNSCQQCQILIQNEESLVLSHVDLYRQDIRYDANSNCLNLNEFKLEKGTNNKSQHKRATQKKQLDDNINKSCALFTDSEFPAGITQLVGENISHSNTITIQKDQNDIVWKRSTEFLKIQKSIFGKNGIQIHKIKQGTLKNCYLLSSLSCLAERPKRIAKLFKSRLISRYGLYSVFLYVNGEQREVIIDDLFPVYHQTGLFLFGGQLKQDLWILLVEKAWAKIHGGYMYLDMGTMREALHDLTGAPCDNYFLENEKEDEIWILITQALQKGYCITCGTKSINNKLLPNNTRMQDHILNEMGLVSSHAYSLLGAYILEDASKTKIIKLRNPWGKDEWNGKFSRKDEKFWESINKELKKKLGYQKSKDDEGIIFMQFEDFFKNFADLQVCMVNDSYKYTAFKTNQQTDKKYFYKISISQSGEYFITVNQKVKNKKEQYLFAGANQTDYSQVMMTLAQWDSKYKRYIYIDGNLDCYREVYTKKSKQQIFKEGDYILCVKVNWINQKDNDEIVISSYGVDSVNICPIDPIENFTRYTMLQHAMFQSENKKCLNKYMKNDFWICMSQMPEGYIYIAAWNNVKENNQNINFYRKNQKIYHKKSSSFVDDLCNQQKYDHQQLKSFDFNCKFIIKNMDGLKLKKPFKENIINFYLKPGQADIALIKCKDLEQLQSFDVEQQFIF
ncbi:calpain family cysteine protease (macronuclear) [Tetrahymena thermophila SB210]|uniref:Calpain family cysteine protease n=1 Tax=Tetrahymena thermophila (strain SB210) TaxID=312017 RepID=I7MF26_TETTS|nr:calpain family cysteine protease [Tetrahymena thermophila SB210]EAR98363.2 calpain family cysteine protease [Tetrahymena thermophila SB210]|eukprot:XP_001018608.2 calpain family cysteine protease [Tetrahymena thermophila SB210]